VPANVPPRQSRLLSPADWGFVICRPAGGDDRMTVKIPLRRSASRIAQSALSRDRAGFHGCHRTATMTISPGFPVKPPPWRTCSSPLSCTKSSRKPEYSPILTPGGQSDRCQRHRGLNDQPTAGADTFGLGMWYGPGNQLTPAGKTRGAPGAVRVARRVRRAGRANPPGAILAGRPGPTQLLRRLVPIDRRSTRTQGRCTRRGNVPRNCVRDLRRAGWPRLTWGWTRSLTVFAQVKAKRKISPPH
jgi:hypothetical protein